MDYNLSSKQTQAAILISFGESKKSAAEHVGVTPQTISEWMSNPSFEATINRYKKSFLHDIQDKLRQSLLPAVETLSDLMDNSENESLKFQVARFIIEKSNIAPDQRGLMDTGPESVIGVLQERKRKGIM